METSWEQASIEAHNRSESWSDIANHLRIAAECVQQAQCALDDLRESGHANLLQPLFDDLRRAANDAREQAGSA